jgi:hypothetical protein
VSDLLQVALRLIVEERRLDRVGRETCDHVGVDHQIVGQSHGVLSRITADAAGRPPLVVDIEERYVVHRGLAPRRGTSPDSSML